MNDNHAIACDALDFALKRGCSAARITLGSGVQSSFSVRDQLLEKVHQAAGNTLTLQLYVAGRYGSFSTNRLKYNDLRLFIEQAISGVRLLAPDPARMLPNPARYYKGNDDLQQFDSELAAVTSQEKKELAFAWCGDANGNGGCHRAQIIRGFARYLVSTGVEAFLMPKGFYPLRKPDLPYIFTDDELRRFFEAADRFPGYCNSPLLEYTVPVVFRLLYACGLRPQEVRLLQRLDFDFSDDTIYIAGGKNRKDRKLPVDTDVMEMCRNYDRIAETITPGRTPFFPSPSGKAYSKWWLTHIFHKHGFS